MRSIIHKGQPFLAISFAFLALIVVGAVQAQDASLAKPDFPGIWEDITYSTGSPSVELIEYGSLTCPACGGFAAQVFPRIKQDFIDTGKVKFIFRNFVRDRYDLAAAAGMRCLNNMDATKRALDMIFAKQSTWMRSENPYAALSEIMGREGMDQADFGRCLSEQSVREFLVDMTQSGAQTYQINSVPSLILNGKLIEFASYEDLQSQINAAIAGRALSN